MELREVEWHLKSCTMWIKKGDENTIFFIIFQIIERSQTPFGKYIRRMGCWLGDSWSLLVSGSIICSPLLKNMNVQILRKF